MSFTVLPSLCPCLSVLKSVLRLLHTRPDGASSSCGAVMGVNPGLLLLVWTCLSAAVIGGAHSESVCLPDGAHKATPGPERHLGECWLYADNSCCSQEDIRDISHTPSAANSNEPWDKCGPLSSQCEGFLKRVTCFYRCSPDAVRWSHPHRRSYIQAVPLCHSFCHDWFEACRMDLTCPRTWATDPRGQNCTAACVQYQQMFQHGRDLCESLWGDAFVTVEDDTGDTGDTGQAAQAGAEGEGGLPCGCLTLSPSDKDVMAALRARQDDPEELDTTKADLPQYRAPCRTKEAEKKKKTRKRSLTVEDLEGSGSGL